MSIRSILVIAGLLVLAAAGPAVAARYHVATGGTRTADASEPGLWSLENCYPTVAAAAAQAAPADSVLLSRDLHPLTSAVTVPAFLGNRDLDTDPTGCELVLTGDGEIRLREASASVSIAGMRWTSDGQAREAAALAIANPGGGLDAVSIIGCDFSGLVGGRPLGGAGVYAEEGRGLTLTVRECTFVDNEAPGRGGAMAIRDGFTVVVEDSEFRRNRAISGGTSPLGGAVYVSSPNEPTSVAILRTDFLGNESARAGGALCIFDASLELDQSQVIGNRSASTGTETWAAGAGLMLRRYDGAHLEPVALVIRGCRFEDNVGNLAAGTGAGDGGGVLVRGIADRMVDVTVEHSDFVDNYNDQGAGLYIGRFTSGLVRYCRFHGNRTYTSGGATFKGGGLPDNLGETAVYRFCEFIGNEAGVTRSGASAWSYAKGGAFSTRHRTRAIFEHCTFVANRVRGVLPWGDAIGLTAEGEDFDSDDERCEMVNCAFWATDGDDVQVRSDPEGFSRVENCAWPEGAFTASGVEPVATVLLAAFPFTMIDQPIPLADAPLVDAGLDLGLTPDLKGDPVPQGLAPDIGAYEVLDDVSDAPATMQPGHLAAHPNPFNPVTRITCDLPTPGPARLEILDLRGRRITLLHAGPLAAGPHVWSWDGRDDRGRLVPGGAYLARLVSGGWTASHKLMLVK